jgi:hypothetical protein
MKHLYPNIGIIFITEKEGRHAWPHYENPFGGGVKILSILSSDIQATQQWAVGAEIYHSIGFIFT